MRKFDIFLGFVFEGAFKLGFVKGRIDNYNNFTHSIFEKLKEEAGEDKDLKDIIEDINKSFPYEIHDPPENMRNLQKLKKGYKEGSEGKISKNWKELYTKLVFALGYVAGTFYSKYIKDVKLKKYHMEEESDDIIWKNADLVFVEEKKKRTLYILDFKLGGARNVLEEIITRNSEDEKIPKIPIPGYGIPVNVALAEIEFKGFLEKFIKVEDELRRTEKVFIEIKGFLQALCYAVDFLCKEEELIDEIRLELIYPMHEPLSLKFVVKDKKGVEVFLDDIKELYKDVKSKKGDQEKLQNRIERFQNPEIKEQAEKLGKILLKGFSQNIEELRKEIEKREKDVIEMPTGDIEEVRKDVKRRLEEFMKNEEPCKAIALLHSAGSGKTSRAREEILKQKGKHIVLYMATRINLLERELEKLKEIKDKNIDLVYERGQKETEEVIDKGTHFEGADNKGMGKIKSAIEEIRKIVVQKKPDYVWAFITIQSVLKNKHGKETSDHLEMLLRPTFKDYHIHIILDEFFGYKNGLFAITEMFEFLKEVQRKGRKANLYLFDANGYSPKLLKKLIDEYKKFEVIPESIALSEYQEELKTYYPEDKDNENPDNKDNERIPFELYAKHGFPAKKLYIHKKFLEVKEDKEIPALIAKYIKETIKEGSSAFAFIQDKELIVDIERELSLVGLESLIATSSSRKSQKQINEGEEDVILGTSSVSRGLDFSRPHKPVDCIYIVVRDWGIENNLVETIQAISRSRGDEETEKREKYLHFIYIISDQNLNIAVDRILNALYSSDEELINEEKLSNKTLKNLVELAYKKEQLGSFLDLDFGLTKIIEQFLYKPSDTAIVPISTQHKSLYNPNIVNEYEEVINFLDDVLYMEKDMGKEHYGILKDFFKKLLEWGYIYTSLPKLEHMEKFEYYHPYILIETESLFSRFSNEQRQELKKNLDKVLEILKQHNEEKAQKVKEFVEGTLPQQASRAPLLMPIYSIVFVKNYLEDGEEMSFAIGKKAGRGHAEVLGGSLEPITFCSAGEREKYAFIPLSEDYSYKEVLSGRFAKFPIKFIRNLLER